MLIDFPPNVPEIVHLIPSFVPQWFIYYTQLLNLSARSWKRIYSHNPPLVLRHSFQGMPEV